MSGLNLNLNFVEVNEDILRNEKGIASKNISSPVGELYIQANECGLTHLRLAEHLQELTECSEFNSKAYDHLAITQQQLEEYFAGHRQHFTMALAPKGTQFQKEVWQALLAVEYGATCCYGDIANRINRPKAVRAVGAANGANSIAIIIPCHRVIGKNGSLTGYAHGLDMKKSLLDVEQVNGFKLS
ncbi:methylated-DNA--[protein]-cysteine S-methyltransferase [Shewanella sp. UCD-KL12]|uniref:methylated-DNA--[protein]-cysteine S-methyltransferase n=1 Tax=Shewanella sp. UCD-KL12 TaxID=1917163 RepID=UPI00117D855F|nr:methylated-DNA--[protein]-cysteine S-methyltransferase [Shewanella sp. UCD-KL12]